MDLKISSRNLKLVMIIHYSLYMKHCICKDLSLHIIVVRRRSPNPPIGAPERRLLEKRLYLESSYP